MVPSRHVLISGCSGGGKSTLLLKLADLGFDVIHEPGRRIVEQELHSGGKALPWLDAAAFARRALDVAAEDRERAAGAHRWTFFDRGLVDAAVALEHAIGQPASLTLAEFAPYHEQVFLVPPWPEIYVADHARRHDFDDAVAEYRRLALAYDRLGYRTFILPEVSVAARAAIVLDELRAQAGSTAR